uniref:SSD domain-containing protein n=1 Tax=Palpitomonas bilix TaxID=652834 RepID=A0A7S3DFY7_9EUKA
MRYLTDNLNSGEVALIPSTSNITNGDYTFVAYSAVNEEVDEAETIVDSLGIAVIITVAATAVVAAIFLRAFFPSLFVLLTIPSVFSMTFGIMAIVGVQLATFTLPVLVMTTGVSVDYSAHIAHAVLHAQKKAKRAKARDRHQLNAVVSVRDGGGYGSSDEGTDAGEGEERQEEGREMAVIYGWKTMGRAVTKSAVTSVVGITVCLFAVSLPVYALAVILLSTFFFSAFQSLFVLPSLLA